MKQKYVYHSLSFHLSVQKANQNSSHQLTNQLQRITKFYVSIIFEKAISQNSQASHNISQNHHKAFSFAFDKRRSSNILGLITSDNNINF